MGVNWSLGIPQGDPGQSFLQAFEAGRARRREEDARKSMNALLLNPNDEKALAAYGQYDPKGALGFRNQQQQNARQALEAHRENILKGAQIVRQLQPRDQASWDHARSVAAQMGIDMSQVPAQFDERYVQGIVSIADAFEPVKQDQGRIITPQPGGGAGIYEGGDFKWIVQPNDGSQQMGAPADAPRVTDEASYSAVPPGAEYIAPDGTRRRKGGQTPSASGAFPASGY